MFRIGEFSKLTQVTVRMLRYYDETKLLPPAEVDPWTGYRLYSVEQIKTLNKILYLRDSGFNISEIAAALEHNDDNCLLEQLEDKFEQINQHIKNEQAKLEKIMLAKKQLIKGTNDMHYHISIKSVPSYHVLSLRRVIPDYYAECLLWKELSEYAAEKKIDVCTDTFSIYHDEDYREENVDVELCALVSKAGKNTDDFVYRYTEAIPIMACTMVYGEFSNLAGAYLSFATWLQKNSQYKMGSTSRQIVHRGPWNEQNPQKYLTEIQIPLEEKSSLDSHTV